MRKHLIFILSVTVAMGLIATAVYADVQNVKVSGDIIVRGIFRKDVDFNGDTTDVQDQGSWLMSTARLRLDADLTDNVGVAVRIINERDWDGEGTAASDDIDLDLAYLTLKDFLLSIHNHPFIIP